MMLLIGFLTVAMVLVCLFLILLVLMQLPKKEAGAGLAFGGAATDALFGSGSGNFLTKATKYSAVSFFCLAILLSVLQSHYSRQNITEFQEELKQPQNQPAAPAMVPAPPPAAPTTVVPKTNLLELTPPSATSNAAPAAKP
jgi:preprotein translocase subunit SecG